MISIRDAVPADAESIRDIYNLEVTTSLATLDLEPRSLEEQRKWIAERSGALAVVVAVSVEVTEGRTTASTVVGFGSLSRFRERPAYNTTVEDSVYVHRDHHGQGVGRLLLSALVERASHHGFHSVIARVVGPQEASMQLHRNLGFELVGTERQVGRKFGSWVDVAVMQLMTDDTPIVSNNNADTNNSADTGITDAKNTGIKNTDNSPANSSADDDTPHHWRWRAEPLSSGPVVVFDVDGVLSDATGRQHYLESDPPDRDGFFAACEQDPPLADNVAMLDVVDPSTVVVLLTARPLWAQDRTVAWLENHGIRWDLLIMRDHHRPKASAAFKADNAEELRARGYQVQLAFEDDQRNIAVYREAGIPCVYIHSGYYD